MRFRSPSTRREEDIGREEEKARGRRQESQQPPTGRQRMPSRSAPQRDRRGEPTVSPSRKCHLSGGRMQSQDNTTWNNNSGSSSTCLSSKIPVDQRQEQEKYPAQSESVSSRPRRRERSHVRHREPSMKREPERRERSCSANRLEGVNSSLNSIHCSLCDQEFAR